MDNENKYPVLQLADKPIHSVYFIGVGGIGMSSLARFFNNQGIEVSGYDRTSSVLTKELEKEGVKIHYEENLQIIPVIVDLVIYTPAIPSTHLELNYYLNNGYKVVKRSDVLQLITEQSFNVCVGGSHGKTTISTMIAHILRDSEFGCNAFLGGVSVNYNSNFWSSNNKVSVIEADEYDRSFLKLSPDIAVITAMDADHLDIYGTAEEVENAYIEFTKKIKIGGCLISKYGLKRDSELKADQHLRYCLDNTNADIFACNIEVKEGAYHFDISYKGKLITDFILSIGGLHNIENAVAAIGVALYMGIEEGKIKMAILKFLGVKRRFEYYIKTPGMVMIDDYAHHPEEIKAFISGIRSLYNHKLTLVFQPHLYSRTKDMASEFATSLDLADEVILLPIYPARELPIEGVSSQLILNKMTIENKRILSKDELLEAISKEKPPLLGLCGAGDIDNLLMPIKEILIIN